AQRAGGQPDGMLRGIGLHSKNRAARNPNGRSSEHLFRCVFILRLHGGCSDTTEDGEEPATKGGCSLLSGLSGPRTFDDIASAFLRSRTSASVRDGHVS